MRVFAALVPPDAAIEDLADFLEPRRADPAARDLSWSRPESWHVTLAFMGSATPDGVDDFIDRLGDGRLDLSVGPLQIRGGGAFPVIERAKVVYAGLTDHGDATGSLERLSERTRNAAAVSGCAPDGRAFTAHLTLARSRRPVEATRWVRVLDAYSGPVWQPEEVQVIESNLGRRGPRYALLASVPIGAGSSDPAHLH